MTVRFRVQVRPGARRRGLRGRLANGVLKVEVAEPPEAGRANEGVVALLAEILGLERRQVRVARGASSRGKWLEIEGLSESEVNSRIESALAKREGGAGGE